MCLKRERTRLIVCLFSYFLFCCCYCLFVLAEFGLFFLGFIHRNSAHRQVVSVCMCARYYIFFEIDHFVGIQIPIGIVGKTIGSDRVHRGYNLLLFRGRYPFIHIITTSVHICFVLSLIALSLTNAIRVIHTILSDCEENQIQWTSASLIELCVISIRRKCFKYTTYGSSWEWPAITFSIYKSSCIFVVVKEFFFLNLCCAPIRFWWTIFF